MLVANAHVGFVDETAQTLHEPFTLPEAFVF
jgi:hypothetical protein